MPISTRIPPIEYTRILQTNLSPETIVALLNAAESLYSDKPKHWNAKRQYPYWKACPTCGALFTVIGWREFWRKNHCSKACANASISKAKTGHVYPERRKGQTFQCPICGKEVYRTAAHLRKGYKQIYCSRSCRAKAHAAHLIPFTGNMKGRKGTPRYGAKNPAWKGGVTYFRKHGNYAPMTKYVRCPAEFLPMARKDGYVMEHRLIVAQHLGRCLKRSEVVHHNDHNPQNNDPRNLLLSASNAAHKKYEATGIPAPLWRL